MRGRRVLGVRDFRLYLLATTISTVGSAFTAVALAFGVLHVTGSATAVGVVLAARSAAQVIFLLLGGAIADRASRRTVMIASQASSAVLQATLGWLLLDGVGVVWLLAALAAANGVAAAFFYPAAAGVVPQLVAAAELQPANALLGLARNASNIGGAALAGVLVAGFGAGWALVVDAASYGCGAMLIAALRPLGASSERSGLIPELRAGWHEFRSRTWLWTIVLQFSVWNMAFVAALSVYVPIVAQRSYGGAAAYGVLVAVNGIGMLVGGLVLLRVHPRRPLLVATLGALAGLPMIALLAAGAPLWGVVAAALVNGVGFETFAVLWSSALQAHIPADRISRVSSYDALGSFALIPVGLALAGPAIGWLGGIDFALWVVCLLMAVPTLAVLAVREVRTLPAAPAAGAGP